MSNDKKAIARIKSDNQSGVVLARVSHAPEVEARAAGFRDPAAISAAQEKLNTFEDRISHLSSLSSVFDDDEDGDGQISLGAIARPAAPREALPVLPVPAPAPISDDMRFDDDDQEEQVVIGGLGDDASDEDFIADVFPAGNDPLFAPFTETADSVTLPAPVSVVAQSPAAALDTDDLLADNFQPADETVIMLNEAASRAVIDQEADLDHDASDLAFLGHDLDDRGAENALSSHEDADENDNIDIEANPALNFEFDAPEDLGTQSLGALIARPAPIEGTALEPQSNGNDFGVDDDFVGMEDIGEDDSYADGAVGQLFPGAAFSMEDDERDGDHEGADAGLSGGMPDTGLEAPRPDWGWVDDGTSVPGSAVGYEEPAAAEADAYDIDNGPGQGAESNIWDAHADTDIPASDEHTPHMSDAWTDGAPASDDDVDIPPAADWLTPANDDYEGEAQLSVQNGDEWADEPGNMPQADENQSWLSAGDEPDEVVPAAPVSKRGGKGAGKPAREPKTGGGNRIMMLAASVAVIALIAGGGFIGATKLGLLGNSPAAVAVSDPAPAQPELIATVQADVTDESPAAPEATTPEPAALPDPAATAEGLTPDGPGLVPDLSGLDLAATPDVTAAPVSDAPGDAPVEAPADVASADGTGTALAGEISDLMSEEIKAPTAITEDVSPAQESDLSLDRIARGLENAADGNLDSLFLTDEKSEIEDAKAEFDTSVVTDLLVDYAKQSEILEVRSAIELLNEKLTTLSDEVVERDQRIVDLEARLTEAGEKAQRAETLALAQNEVLVEFVRVKEKVDMAESLIVDLSRRIGSMETTDPADRVAVERSLEDLNTRIEGMARDIGLVARYAINGSPEKARGTTSPSSIPGSSAVYETTKTGMAPQGDPGRVPSNVKVGDFVEGYGAVLQIMPTSDGSRVVVMENNSVLLPN